MKTIKQLLEEITAQNKASLEKTSHKIKELEAGLTRDGNAPCHHRAPGAPLLPPSLAARRGLYVIQGGKLDDTP